MTTPDLAVDTRPSLLLRIRDPRDAEAWRTFANLYAPLVFQHCRRKQLQDADATDLTQDVLLVVAQSIRNFVYEPHRGRFRDWLWTITNHRLGRFLARKQQQNAAVVSVEELAVDPIAASDVEWTADFNARVLNAALERIRPHFEPATWRAFECAWLENRTAAATADELGVPIETVYVAKSRVLKRLAEEVRLLAEDLPQTVPLARARKNEP
jgi:RNA polymerase sigma factor (sigma-70 family)